MTEGLFVISNAIIPPDGLSRYSIDERFNQTLETIDSIDKYCPNNEKIMFDASAVRPDKKYFDELASRKITVMYTGQNPNVNQLSKRGAKSPAEVFSFLMVLNWINDLEIQSKRIYKISGRYQLNENFIPGLEHEGKYVFTVPTKTWMSQDQIDRAGVDHVYQSRLLHFDRSLLKQTIEELENVLRDCLELGIDIEHGYHKYFKKFNPIEMEVIGLCGNLAPNGEYIDE